MVLTDLSMNSLISLNDAFIIYNSTIVQVTTQVEFVRVTAIDLPLECISIWSQTDSTISELPFTGSIRERVEFFKVPQVEFTDDVFDSINSTSSNVPGVRAYSTSGLNPTSAAISSYSDQLYHTSSNSTPNDLSIIRSVRELSTPISGAFNGSHGSWSNVELNLERLYLPLPSSQASLVNMLDAHVQPIQDIQPVVYVLLDMDNPAAENTNFSQADLDDFLLEEVSSRSRIGSSINSL